MANRKRIEQKLPLLISNGPSWSYEYEEKEHLVKKLKRNIPAEYNSDLNELFNIYDRIEKKALLQKKNHNGHRES